MDNFKEFYIKDNVITENILDVIGDVRASAVSKIKQTAKDKFPGTSKVLNRLFNVENKILNLLKDRQYKNLGKLLIDEKMPQDFVFKRVSLFGKNKELGISSSKKYRDVPLFFVIISMLIDDKATANKISPILSDIESAGIDISTYLNRRTGDNKDIVSFILTAPSVPPISSTSTIEDTDTSEESTEFEKICIELIKTLMLFGYDIRNAGMTGLNAAIRLGSVSILRAFFESKYPIKLTADIENVANRSGKANIIKYIESLKATIPTAKPADKITKSKIGSLDLTKYGYDSKVIGVQKIKHADGLKMIEEISKAINKKVAPEKLANMSKNKAMLTMALTVKLRTLDMASNIAIV